MTGLLEYDLGGGVRAFTAGRDVPLPCGVVQPHQTHSTVVAHVDRPGLTREELEGVDALVTELPDVAIGVRTADCIPVLLYDSSKHLVAAIHAGWRGTVGRIVERTVREMGSAGQDLHAIIGPGISLQAFEVGDEVYSAFRDECFPMERMAKRYPCRTGGERWHLDLWEANRWLLENMGVADVHVAGVCTKASPLFYSARRETIDTGRNYNGILLVP